MLRHTVAFHGLNTGPGLDDSWLLKIVKMIGWPESLLPPPSLHSRWGLDVLESNFSRSYSHPQKPARPKLVSRHSGDRYINTGAVIAGNPNALLNQQKYSSRSRSASYPNTLPDFYGRNKSYCKTGASALGLHHMETVSQVTPVSVPSGSIHLHSFPHSSFLLLYASRRTI